MPRIYVPVVKDARTGKVIRSGDPQDYNDAKSTLDDWWRSDMYTASGRTNRHYTLKKIKANGKR